ncbi:hypothetical protein Droror1_Dr00004923 [Drosera rotundifolia]
MSSFTSLCSSAFKLDITIISAEDLRIGNRRPVKKSTFVRVRADANAAYQATKADMEGGSYPLWNEKLEISMPTGMKFITLEVRQGSSDRDSGSKMIAMVPVPVSDFIGDGTPLGYLHLLSYRLRDSQRQPNGFINFMLRVKTGVDNHQSTCGDAPRPQVGFPVASSGKSQCPLVVTGVPLS